MDEQFIPNNPVKWEDRPWYKSATKIVLLVFTGAITIFSGFLVVTKGEIPEPFSLALASVIAFYFGQKQLTK